MIVCTRCGSNNADDNRFCGGCGRKLQSDARPRLSPQDADCAAEETLPLLGQGGEKVPGLGRYLEAWVYVGAALGGVAAAFLSDSLKPLYVVIPLLVLAAWLRKV